MYIVYIIYIHTFLTVRQEAVGANVMPLAPKNIRDWGANMEGIIRGNRRLIFFHCAMQRYCHITHERHDHIVCDNK